MNITIIVFAGKGVRINSSIPKQFIKVNDKELISYTIDKFEEHPLIDKIVLVTSKDYIALTKSIVFKAHYNKIVDVIEGGDYRQASVYNALKMPIFNDDDNVLIHDGDRPNITTELITLCIKNLEESNSAVLYIKSDVALTNVSNSGRKIIVDNVSFDVQTPQCFKYKLIKRGHDLFKNVEVSDDATLVEMSGEKVNYILGDSLNFKVTLDKDLDYFKKLVEEK